MALVSLTSSLAVTSPPLVDRMRVADLPVFLKELKIARRLATSSPIFPSDSEEKRVCEELTNSMVQDQAINHDYVINETFQILLESSIGDIVSH